MSKRAEEAALKAYPPETKKAIQLLPRDWNKPMRTAFIQGYEQAEKDIIAIVKKNIEIAVRCMEQSTGFEEYPYWDGANDMANAIRREIEQNFAKKGMIEYENTGEHTDR